MNHTVDEAPSPTVLVFIADLESAGVVRQSLSDIGLTNAQTEFISGNVRTATETLAQRPSPRLLIVEISEIDDPATRLSELARVCEPNTSLVVVGDKNDIKLYRQLKSVGVT
jgi:pilus assembly protein CpaE